MNIRHLHPWKVTPSDAISIQKQFQQRIEVNNDFGEIRTVAGVDIGIKNDMARAAVVVLSYPQLKPIEQSVAERPVEFPYVPGLLSFREIPVLIDAFEGLSLEPDLIIADGQGTAHPRRFGLACHLGLVLDKPVIGSAKSRLCGRFEEPSAEKGSFSYLYDREEIIGAALRTRTGTRVVFVSSGHRIDLETSIACVLACCPKFRLPETTRWAHKVAGGGSILNE